MTEPIPWPKQCPSCGHKTVGTARWCDRHECEELWWETRICELGDELDKSLELLRQHRGRIRTLRDAFLAYYHEWTTPRSVRDARIEAAAKLCEELND